MSNFTKNVLVIGGGVAGLSAARALHEREIGVHLVEKSDHLGGKAFDWACMATDACQNCGACLAAELVDLVPGQDNTEIYTRTELSGLTKKDDGYEAILDGEAARTVKVDGVLMATGFQVYDPSPLTSLGYGKHDNVVTTAELNELLKTGRISEKFPPGDSPAVAFIQCVGSRSRKLERNYCSQVCCKISLRHANKLLHLYPEAEISIFHMDLQIMGKEFRTFTDRLAGRVELPQGVAAEISSDRNEGKLTLFHEDQSLGVRKAHHFDMVVLSVGMGAAENSGELALKLGIKPGPWGFLSQKDADAPRAVYAAGAVQGPMSILSAMQQGRISADKIAKDFQIIPESARRTPTAVIGGGDDANAVAKALVDAGRAVILIDPGKNNNVETSGLERISEAGLISAAGAVGNFTLKVQSAAGEKKVTAGAIIVASEAERFKDEDVYLPEKIISLEEYKRHPEEKIPQKVGFLIDYFGPENKVNARSVLEAATSLAREGKTVYVVMNKMLVNGLSGQQTYDDARKSGVKFLRGAKKPPAPFTVDNDHVNIVFEEETLPGMEISLSLDLLVIPEKAAPPGDILALSEILDQPLDAEGFIQSPNSRHRPVGSPRRGIFFAGNCHDECDGSDLNFEISEILAGLDYLEKNGSPVEEAPEIFEKECIKCLTCLRVCPHGAVMLQKTNKPRIIHEACFECGLCVSNCPAKAIKQEAFSDRKISGGDEMAETFVFACERSAHLAAKEAARLGIDLSEKIHIQPVRCAGRVGLENMFAPLLKGAKRVVVAGCHEGNCRSMDSGSYARMRIEQTAESLGFAAERLRFYPVAANEPDRFRKITSDDE